ncbi:hypothetical protein D3C84_833580 [compost metagenome]
MRGKWLFGIDIDALQRLVQRRNRLHDAAHDDLLSVGHTALEAAQTVRSAVVAALFIVQNFIMHLRTADRACFKANADLNALECVNRHYRLRDASVQLAVVLNVAAQTDRYAFNYALDDTADRVAFRLDLIDVSGHLLFRFLVDDAY